MAISNSWESLPMITTFEPIPLIRVVRNMPFSMENDRCIMFAEIVKEVAMKFTSFDRIDKSRLLGHLTSDPEVSWIIRNFCVKCNEGKSFNLVKIINVIREQRTVFFGQYRASNHVIIFLDFLSLVGEIVEDFYTSISGNISKWYLYALFF